MACEIQLSCAPGSEPIDTDADNCADTCQFLCQDPCECVDNAGEAGASCGPDDLSASWECTFGVCVEACSPLIEVIQSCPTGCNDTAACLDSEYCHKALGSCAEHGVCEALPTLCATDVSDPTANQVCGCDDVDYPTACHAHLDGVSVASLGPCAP